MQVNTRKLLLSLAPALAVALLGSTGCQGGKSRVAAEAGGSISSAENWRRHQSADLNRPPAREPGPPRAESPEKLQGAAGEAAELSRQLKQAGVAPREIASILDMRGYRLYRQRWFGQAAAWFEAAVAMDPAYELSLYNAARVQALQGATGRASELLDRLRELATPLSNRRLDLLSEDSDFSSWRQAADAGRR